MPLTPPSKAISPLSKIKTVKVLYDGTLPGHAEFSIAQLELHKGPPAMGIRHDRNVWNSNTDENGYPVVRGGRPSWFILPDTNALLTELNKLKSEGKLNF